MVLGAPTVAALGQPPSRMARPSRGAIRDYWVVPEIPAILREFTVAITRLAEKAVEAALAARREAS